MIESSFVLTPGLHPEAVRSCSLLNSSLRLFALSHGPGRGQASRLAAQRAVGAIVDFFELINNSQEQGGSQSADSIFTPATIERAMEHANRALLDLASEMGRPRFGIACALSCILEDRALFCQVGDCRIYLFRKGRLKLLTKEHSLAQEKIQGGELDRDHCDDPARHVGTQALGSLDPGPLEVEALQLVSGDRLLICFSALAHALSDAEIARCLDAESQLDACCSCLERQARLNRSGDQEGITAVLLRYMP